MRFITRFLKELNFGTVEKPNYSPALIHELDYDYEPKVGDKIKIYNTRLIEYRIVKFYYKNFPDYKICIVTIENVEEGGE